MSYIVTRHDTGKVVAYHRNYADGTADLMASVRKVGSEYRVVFYYGLESEGDWYDDFHGACEAANEYARFGQPHLM